MKVLITGASSGIGRDMAKELAKRKYDLVLVARNKEKLEEIQRELKDKRNVNVEIIQLDISNEENCIELHNRVQDVDILINNAGFGDCGDFAETELEKDLTMIKTNIIALHTLTKLYLKDMKNKATYYSTKAYVVRLSESIREELKKANSNVQISILCPGPVNTNFNKVANVRFDMKSRTSEQVAKYAIEKFLNGKFRIIPGFDVKLGIFFAKLLPSSLMAKITYNVQKRKLYR